MAHPPTKVSYLVDPGELLAGQEARVAGVEPLKDEVNVGTAHLRFVVGQNATEVTQRHAVRVLEKDRIHVYM